MPSEFDNRQGLCYVLSTSRPYFINRLEAEVWDIYSIPARYCFYYFVSEGVIRLGYEK